MATNEVLLAMSLASALMVGIGTTIKLILTHRRDRRTDHHDSFAEMRALKEEYQQRAEALEAEIAALRAKIEDLEKRSRKLEQENTELRLEIACLHAGISERRGL